VRWWFGQLLAWLVMLSITAVLGAAVLVPRVSGATPYTVLTGSMEPGYPPGTLVVVRPTSFDKLRVGDIITYQIESGEPEVATHRIVDFTFNLAGDRRAITQGDANSIPDREPVRDVQVRGRLWYSVAYLGYVNNLVTGRQRQQVLVATVTFLVLYSAYMFASAGKEQWQKRRNEPEPESEPRKESVSA
jgi:signal peptidase